MRKYARFYVDVLLAKTGYDNFEELFKYIGENVDAPRKSIEGKAYFAIRKETDKILNVGFIKDRTLKTSKAEIKTIRQCFKNKKIKKIDVKEEYIMKIPYKIDYIFHAIINLVNEIKEEKNIPANLNNVVGYTYGKAFYKKYIDVYSKNYQSIINKVTPNPDDFDCVLSLKNDFECEDSSLQVKFI